MSQSSDYNFRVDEILPCDAMQGTVMPPCVVCPSVCLSVHASVCDVQVPYRHHICLNTSKIISWLISLRFPFGLTPTWAIWCNGNTPKIRVELGWGHEAMLKPVLNMLVRNDGVDIGIISLSNLSFSALGNLWK